MASDSSERNEGPDPRDNRRLAFRLEPDVEAEGTPLVYVRMVSDPDRDPVICELVDVSADGVALIWPSRAEVERDEESDLLLTIYIPEMPPAIRFRGRVRYAIPSAPRGVRLGIAFVGEEEGSFEEEQSRLVTYVMQRQRQQIRTIKAREEV